MHVSFFVRASTNGGTAPSTHVSTEVYDNDLVPQKKSFVVSIESGSNLISLYFYDKSQLIQFQQEMGLALSNLIGNL